MSFQRRRAVIHFKFNCRQKIEGSIIPRNCCWFLPFGISCFSFSVKVLGNKCLDICLQLTIADALLAGHSAGMWTGGRFGFPCPHSLSHCSYITVAASAGYQTVNDLLGGLTDRADAADWRLCHPTWLPSLFQSRALDASSQLISLLLYGVDLNL